MNKSVLLALCSVFCLFAFSCKTFGGVQKETLPLDYTNDDVVRNEIKRIDEFLSAEPVEAYWRSLLLGDEEVTDRCVNHISNLVSQAVEEKDYVAAWRYVNSLETTGKTCAGFSFEQVDALLRKDVPGFQPNESKPSTISDCIKATVTVIVDKGIKITNGAGTADKSLGSGFFIDKRGYIITNHHVISEMVDSTYEGYCRLYIKLSDNEDDKIPAKVIGYDPVIDLALLKVEIIPEFVFSLGTSEELKVGEKINVIGAPLGLESSLSEGIVSNTKRKLFNTGDVFQIDAPVNSGNSGGPCVDKKMEVQAIVFAGVLRAQGLNFAIPVEYLKQELPFLYAGGEYMHSWTGCYGHTQKSGSRKTGVDVQYVMPGSPAKLSGLKAGETITKVNDIPVNEIEKLHSIFRNLNPGTIIKVQGLDAQEQDFVSYVYLKKRGTDPAVEMYESDLIENSFLPLYGMQLLPSSTTYRNSYKVDSVLDGTSAEELQFSENDPVSVKKVKIDKENKYILTQIVTKRHKRNLLDVTMMLAAPFDGPYYF
ncbi:MAG: S1C family serine protease [Treponema sp.]|nr:S1C family serine protease [Treponema sp.]